MIRPSAGGVSVATAQSCPEKLGGYVGVALDLTYASSRSLRLSDYISVHSMVSILIPTDDRRFPSTEQPFSSISPSSYLVGLSVFPYGKGTSTRLFGLSSTS